MTALSSVNRKDIKYKAKRGVSGAIIMAVVSLCLLGAIAGCASSAAYVNESGDGSSTHFTEPDRPSVSQSPTLRCNYYNEKEFMASLEAAGRGEGTGAGNDADGYSIGKDTSKANSAGRNLTGGSSRIAGGVTPHHLLAADMIAAFFREMSVNPPDTIVVIGPNHKRLGFSGLNTSSSDWGTPFGRLEANRDIVKLLAEKFNAASNDRLMQDEHSISSLMPYIGYYMPDVSIVPILLHGNYTSDNALKLGKFLGDMAGEKGDIAIIASIDFSHYLDAKTADKMDDITWAAIESRDIQAISIMGNDNLDSPPSIIALLGAMGEAGAQGPEKSGHSNSSIIAGGGADYTTSYFTMFYRYIDK